MSEAIFSNQWYRVEYLTPQLHGHVGVHRHAYRGLIWYILEDKSSGRHHRFNEAAYRFIGLLDGYRTVNQAWELICERFGDDAPTQNDVIQLLAKLHNGNLLKSGVAINTEELLERHERHQNTKFFQILTNPFSQKIPLWDPDAFLQRHLLKVRWLFQRSMPVLWLLLVTGAGLLAAIHWRELTGNALINTLSPYNLTLLFILYPLIKLLHEMGHAFATKIAGGDVHEMGIMFLLLVPIPYVNVSAASHFRNKYTRMLVGAAGIMVELLLASLSLYLWLMIEPGIVRDIIFNIMLIGGFSTLFFNGNPLLKYDGYYVFADALELPNLAQRANSYCIYLCQHYVFGFKQAQSPAYTWGESVWFFIYSISSFVYRLGILWFIVVYVTEKFFVIGIILACWLITAQIIFPLFKIGHFIYTSLAIRDHQYRIAGVSVVVLRGLSGYPSTPS